MELSLYGKYHHDDITLKKDEQVCVLQTGRRALAILRALRYTEASLCGMYKGFVSWILVVIMRQTSLYHIAIKGKVSSKKWNLFFLF